MNNQTKFSSLEEIAKWQLDADNAKIGLPAMQRGYVWKPKQVETLWDSLLRGFPIGSFLISENDGKGLKKDLLDGQQRATAIAMGFYNPWDESQHPNFYSSKYKSPQKTVPVLWLDLAVKDGTSLGEKDDGLFLPRLVTQSHPWGYNLNGDTLGISVRRNAMAIFNESGLRYPHYNLKDVYPVKADLPVPMNFLISSIRDCKENWRDKLVEYCKKYLFLNGIKNGNEITNFFSTLEDILFNEPVSRNIELAIKILLETQIPVISLNKKQLEEESNTANANASTIFVRINTAGTGLFGEELIYSMYKSVFPEFKNIVEEAGLSFIAPSRIITLISRIALTDLSLKNQELKFASQLKLKEFKSKIKNEEGDFYKAIKQFTEDEKPYINDLFSKAKEVLIGSNSFQLPFPLAAEIARNQNVFFIFIYWLHKSKIELDEILNNEVIHKKILASITALCWFSIDTNLFLNELAKEIKLSGKFEFWNPKLFSNSQSIEDNNQRWLVMLPNPDFVRLKLVRKINNGWDNVFDNDEKQKNQFLTFFNKLHDQRQILLYVQRNYLNSKFTELQWDTLLEDTNRPYDWDHIYPDNWWTYSIVNYSSLTHEWRWCIGNFRALALEENRAQGDRLSPKSRLEKNRLISFITDDNWKYWENIDDKVNEQQLVILAQAIVHRLADIYKEWYEQLEVGELFEFKTNSN